MTRRSQSVVPYILFCIWPIALLPKVLQLGVLFAIGTLMVSYSYKTMGEYVIHAPETALFLYFFIYFLSVTLNLLHSNTERILATFNTLALWAISILLYVLYKNAIFNINAISSLSTINILILSLLSVVYFLHPGLQVSLLGRPLVGTDWLEGEETSRFFAFFEYPNLVPAFCLILFPLSLRVISRIKTRFWAYAYCFSILPPIAASASRMGVILGIAMVAVGVMYIHSGASRPLFSTRVLILLGIFLAASVAFIYRDTLWNLLEKLFFSRSGSNSARFGLYEASLSQMLNRNVLLGCGIKDLSPEFGDKIPLGSHSTYLGALYKTGIIGFVCFVVALFLIIKRILINSSDILYSASCIAIILLFFTLEDVDGANWLLALLLSVAGILSNECLSTTCLPRETVPCSTR